MSSSAFKAGGIAINTLQNLQIYKILQSDVCCALSQNKYQDKPKTIWVIFFVSLLIFFEIYGNSTCQFSYFVAFLKAASLVI